MFVLKAEPVTAASARQSHFPLPLWESVDRARARGAPISYSGTRHHGPGGSFFSSSAASSEFHQDIESTKLDLWPRVGCALWLASPYVRISEMKRSEQLRALAI